MYHFYHSFFPSCLILTGRQETILTFQMILNILTQIILHRLCWCVSSVIRPWSLLSIFPIKFGVYDGPMWPYVSQCVPVLQYCSWGSLRLCSVSRGLWISGDLTSSEDTPCWPDLQHSAAPWLASTGQPPSSGEYFTGWPPPPQLHVGPRSQSLTSGELFRASPPRICSCWDTDDHLKREGKKIMTVKLRFWGTKTM